MDEERHVGEIKEEGSKLNNLTERIAEFNIVKVVKPNDEDFKNLLLDSVFMQIEIIRHRLTKTYLRTQHF